MQIKSIEGIASLIDQTILKPYLSLEGLEGELTAALRYPFAAVIVPPYYVGKACRFLKDTSIKIGTVVGFPLGFQRSMIKEREAERAIKDGASEIDMVINICAFKSRDYRFVLKEIKGVSNAAKGVCLKVIVETCYLNEEEKIVVCGIIADSGADFIKTSTGFGPSGARLEDVRLLKKNAKGRIKVKASGGILDLNAFLSMIEAGADRVGTSSGVSIVEDYLKKISLKSS